MLDQRAQLAECRLDCGRYLGDGRALAPPAGHVEQHAVGLEQVAEADWHSKQHAAGSRVQGASGEVGQGKGGG